MRRNRGGPCKTAPATDLTRWRLKSVDGRQTWHYLESDKDCQNWPQTLLDKHSIGLPTVSLTLSNIDMIVNLLQRYIVMLTEPVIVTPM